MSKIPNSVPQMKQDAVRTILARKGIDRKKYPVCVLAVRGYYLDTMGEKGKNDRGIYDDACFIDSPTIFVSVNWNTDPSSYRKGTGTGSNKGMASLKPGVWEYKIGPHKGKSPACRQAANVTVIRDGKNGDYEDTGDFAINHHWGSLFGTSSAGCQTAPPKQWPSYINPLVAELKRYDQKTFKYVLITEAERKKILAENDAEVAPYNPTTPTNGPITTGMDPDEGTQPWYRRMFKACEVDAGKESQLRNTVKLIKEGFDRYLIVSKLLGASDTENFAWILGAIHFKEASCNFKGVLHNGDQIIGTGKKTIRVPAGRGPFNSWEQAAVDAISMNPSRWKKLLSGNNDIGEILYALERYNGTGYITGAGKAENSPYLWACSNINDDKGKYVSDGKFDANASTQSTSGAALILKELYKEGAFKVTV